MVTMVNTPHPKWVYIDFETRSRCNLKTAGGDNYAADPSTDILCMSAIDMETDQEWLWYPAEGALPDDLVEAINTAEFIVAQNARFDQLIWEFIAVDLYGFPALPRDKWYCSAAQCRVNAFPAALDAAARALDGKHRKDPVGGALIRKLSIPNKQTGEFTECAETLKAMGEYCLQDSRTGVEIVRGTRLLSAVEHEDWLVSEAINDRGILVDTELAQLALDYAMIEQDTIADELEEETRGDVTKHTQHVRIKKWLLDRLDGNLPAIAHMTKIIDGVEKISADKAVRSAMMTAADSGDITLPDDVYNVLLMVSDGNKSSVAKFKRMISLACPEDNRVRGAFLYAGAGQTKRYSSKGLQVHNFTRSCFGAEDAVVVKNIMAAGDPLNDVMGTLTKLLRPAIIPEDGKVFVVGDWSAIEGRFLPWLSKDKRAEKVLDVFRTDHPDSCQCAECDIYVNTAESMGIKDRQIGKVATLSLGYQGAVNAFMSMGKNYGLALPEGRIKAIVTDWRGANPWAPAFWAACERAAIDAMGDASVEKHAGRLRYVYLKKLIGGTLLCILPDGTTIQYPKARVEKETTEWGTKEAVTYMKASIAPTVDATEWPRSSLYGGLLVENATQAIAASLLREKLREIDGDVVLHVHDEIVLEVPASVAEITKIKLQECMERVPDWAGDLPLKAVPEIMSRYGK